jgi:translation initiation factor IF-2
MNRVYELAKHFGVSSKVLLEVLEELGVMAKSHMSVLSEEDSVLVARHFEEVQAHCDKVGEKTQRFEVEKARPKAKRLSAREKLAAKRKQQKESAAKKATPEAAPAAEKPRARRLDRVKAPRAEAPPSAAPEASAPETASEAAAPGATEAATPRAETRAARPKKSVADLKSIAKAAAETRARIADDTKTRRAEPPVPARPRPAREDARRGGRPMYDAEESKPRPIDPKAIRKSVRQTLAKLDVGRGSGGMMPGPTVPKPRKRLARRAREDKRDRVARQRARAEAQRAVDDTLRITEFITVQELAQKLGVKPSELITKLMQIGVMATINQRLERDAIEVLVADYDAKIKWLDPSAGEDLEEEEEAGERLPRSPVVTVMGHVDHGKTTLLDHLRSANVTATEAGGITQHIGAYQVETPRGQITFLDTPGHEAFTAMRARGAKVTDIVVIVVAADDKIMPQTVEAIDHARASNCPVIIAINKIDLPAADPAGVKQQLMQHNVLVEEFGGQVQCVEISAKRGTNIDSLLEAIALQAEILELTAVREGHAHGTVIEARKDPGRGTVFTVLVTQGTLRVGDPFVVGASSGRVRAMLDEREDQVEEAGPARPVLVLGADEVPVAGDQLRVTSSEREAKDIAGRRRRVQREVSQVTRKRTTLETLFDRIQEQEQVELKLCIKGDVAGSVEALSDALIGLANEKVAVTVIHSGVGAINENDIMLAAASEAIVIGFHLRPGPAIRNLAKEHRVALHLYDVIYEAVDEVKKAMQGLLEPIEREVRLGSAEVRELFRVPKAGVIAGSYVLEGTVRRNSRVRVVRDQVPIYEGVISSLKRFKEDAREVQTGFECGIGVENFDDLRVGDILEVYEVQQVAQEL